MKKYAKNRDPTLWFVCRICRRAFHRRKYFLRHKRVGHPNHQVNVEDNRNNNNDFKKEPQQQQQQPLFIIDGLSKSESSLFNSSQGSDGSTTTTTTTVDNENNSSLSSPMIERLDDGVSGIAEAEKNNNKIMKNYEDERQNVTEHVIRRSDRIAFIKAERQEMLTLEQKFGYGSKNKGGKKKRMGWSNYDSKDVPSSSSSGSEEVNSSIMEPKCKMVTRIYRDEESIVD